MSTNPFDEGQTGKLSAEDQDEYDRLAAEEQAGGDKTDETPANLAEDDPRAAHDEDVAARYPVENGAVRWDDAANEGNTDRGTVHTYQTPWGKRPMDEREVSDLAAQGVVCERVDDEAETSLQQEKDDMAHVEFAPKSDKH